MTPETLTKEDMTAKWEVGICFSTLLVRDQDTELIKIQGIEGEGKILEIFVIEAAADLHPHA